jgi:integrase
LVPGAVVDSEAPAQRWLDRYSAPLDGLDPMLLEAALTAATTKRDGSMASAEVARRRRTTLNAVLKAAVRRDLLPANPMDKVEWKLPKRSVVVDVAVLPSFADIVAIVDWTVALPTAAGRYGALFACVGMAGMRPSEAGHLRVADLDLPEERCGLARLRGSTASPGRRFVAGDGVHEDKALKQRAVGEVRPVPLPPVLVEVLRGHLARFEPVEGRVFTTSTGRPFTSTSYTETWNRARAHRWPAESPLASTTLYDLRHSAATLMLRAGVSPAEVARRLGHSVDVLMRVYAGVFVGERERSNDLIEAAQTDEMDTPAGPPPPARRTRRPRGGDRSLGI